MKQIIQVAGIIDNEEAKMLMDLGVEYLGFPLRLPINKEDCSEDEAAEIIKNITPPHKAVLITYLDAADEIIAFCNKLNVKIVQLHGHIELEELIKIKQLRPDIEVIKSLVVKGNNLPELEDKVKTLSHWVDMFITDTFDPDTGASGATGKSHDLNPDNVKRAILFTNPAGVDVHTGIENKSGKKDFELTKQFVFECSTAFSQL